MDIKYKHSDIGLIPKEWDVAKLGRIAEINPESLSSNTPKDYLIQYIDIESVSTGSISNTKEMVFEDSPSRARRIVKQNDVIVSTVRPYLKAFAIVKNDDDNQICSTGFAVIRVKREVDYQFIYQNTLGEQFLNQLNKKMVGSNYPAVNASDIKDMLFPVPPLTEQKKIAKILSTVDGHIDEVDGMIEDLKELKKGLMQKLLTDGIGHSEFKDSEVGRIPVEWEVKKLYGCIHKVLDYRGRTPKKLGMDWGEGDIPALSANNVKMGKVDLTLPTYYGSEELHEKWMNDADLEFGDVLMTMEAPLGNVAQVPTNGKYILSQRVVAFKVKPIISNNYLRYVLMSPRFQKELELHSTGTTAKGINQKNLSKLYITVPPIDEQNRISTILSSVDLRLNVYEEQLEEFVDLKKGLMQQLLTGKTRVKIDN